MVGQVKQISLSSNWKSECTFPRPFPTVNCACIRGGIRSVVMRASKKSSPRSHRRKNSEPFSARRRNQHARRVRYPCDGGLSILYLEHAISAKEDGGHYAHDNCCPKNKTRPVGREGFPAASRHRLHRVLCRQREAGGAFLQDGVWFSKPCLFRTGNGNERESELRDPSEQPHVGANDSDPTE